MEKLWRLEVPWWCLILRAGVIYLAILVLLRVSGKRQVGQMGLGEFVALLLISNAVQNAMNGGDNSLLGGLILATTIILLSIAFTFATYRWRNLEYVAQGRPTLLIHHGKLLNNNLKHEWLSIRELRHLLRKQGVHDFAEIEEAVLESDGYISIVKKSELKEIEEMRKNEDY